MLIVKKSKEYNEKYFSCSHRNREEDRVSGELLKIAKKAEKLALTMHELLTPFSSPGLNTSRFMQSGTRTNGLLERAGSLSKLFSIANGYLRDLEMLEQQIKDRRESAQSMLALLENYVMCDMCKGKRGELLGPNYWVDCGTCDGQGMVKNRSK